MDEETGGRLTDPARRASPPATGPDEDSTTVFTRFASAGQLTDALHNSRLLLDASETMSTAESLTEVVEAVGKLTSAGSAPAFAGIGFADTSAAALTLVMAPSKTVELGERWNRIGMREMYPPARSLRDLRKGGIEDISLDLIFGLPASLGRDWQADLNHAFDLKPEHLSLYGLTIEPHTPLGRWTARGEATPVDEDSYASEFLLAHAALRTRGYDHYEVSNAGQPGHRARHNSAYWRRAPFIGLGPSAHSGFANERRWNVREWANYQRLVESGKSPREGRERLDPAAIRLEELYLGLRTSDGLPLDQVPEPIGQAWEREGWATRTQERLQLTSEGWLRLDALVPAIKG